MTQDLFIPVPETTLPDGTIVPAFRAGQYAATRGADGKAAVVADAAPWTNINHADTRKACAAAGYNLITETQWLAIAWNASQQDCNWTKGKVGEGKLFRGIRNCNVSSAQPGNFEPTDKKERRALPEREEGHGLATERRRQLVRPCARPGRLLGLGVRCRRVLPPQRLAGRRGRLRRLPLHPTRSLNSGPWSRQRRDLTPQGRIMQKDCLIPIPETTLPGGLVVPAFQIGQYPSSKAKGKLAITAEGTPWVRINFRNAIDACHTAGYLLAKESQRLAVAYHIAAQDENWTGGKVGKGKLFQGLCKGTNHGPQPNNITASTDPDERRWFALPGGHRIYDIAGNVWEWTFDDIQGDKQGLIAKPFKADSPSIVIPYPEEDKGQGWTPRTGADWSGRALFRGGFWLSESNAGAFDLYYDWPSLVYGYVGFRCTLPGL